MYEQYDHHGFNVWVRTDLKGKHRSFCLCFSCDRFKPGTDQNCPIANATYQNCIRYGLTTPVFECPMFNPNKKPHHGQAIRLEDVKANDELRSSMLGLKVLIRSSEHDCFWLENGCGYTSNAWDAGIYDFEDAFDHTKHYGPEKGIEFVVF